MKWVEFHPGQIIEAGPYEIGEAEIIEFARAYDPQWFHTDVAASDAGPHGGLIASGWQTCAVAMKLVVEKALQGSESYASPGLSYVKWTAPVRPGDQLSVRATVLETRRSGSKPTMGLLRWRWQLYNAAGTQVLDLEATSVFELPPL